MKTNDQNNFAKRTVSTIKSILNANKINFDLVVNDGDNNQFTVICDASIRTKMQLKQAGFIRLYSDSNSITLKCH
jgi:hypothetical protein